MNLLRTKVLLAAFAALFLTAGSAFADIVLYATSRGDQELVKVNLTTNVVTVLKHTKGFPDSMLVDQMGRIIYDESDLSTLRRFDPVANTDELLADSSTGINGPQDLALDPTNRYVYVSNFLGNTITRTDLTQPFATATIILANVPAPEGLAFDNTGRLFALIGFGNAARIVQLDPNTGAILNTSTMFDPTNSLDGLVYDPFTNSLYATTQFGNGIYKINQNTLVGTKLPGVIGAPDGLISDSAGKLYVAGRATFNVYSYDLTTNQVLQLTSVPGIDDLGPVVLSPPTILKTFGAPMVVVGSTTTVNFTITNPNAVPLLGVNFTDTLPAGLVVSTPNGLNPLTGCNGIVPTATAGSTTVSLTGVSLALSGSPGSSCTFSINVTGVTPGLQHNCVTASGNNAGPGNTSCADITVVAQPPVLVPPAIVKAFGAPSIVVGATTTLTFTLSNTNASALNAVNFIDTLPAGLVVATPNGLNPLTGCNGTVPSAVAGSSTVSVTNASLAASPGAGSSCTFSINVLGATAGVKPNSVTVSDTAAGLGNTSNATLTVIAPPALGKQFGAGSVVLGGTTTLTFTVVNSNTTTTLTGISVTDVIPAGLIISTPNGLNPVTGCNGVVPTATAGTNTITLTGLSLAPSAACSFTVNVTAIGLGPQNNITSVITSVNGGSGPPAQASIPVVSPALDDVYQIKYAANLNVGESYFNFTNAGTFNGADPAGRICANVYTFDPNEELISCCSCLITPNGLNTLSARADLISNTLTPGVPTSITVKVLASIPIGGSCNAAAPTAATLVRGLRAWGTTIHMQPAGAPTAYGTTETPFAIAELSTTELTKLTGFCSFIQTIGSGFGICPSCRLGAQGATTK